MASAVLALGAMGPAMAERTHYTHSAGCASALHLPLSGYYADTFVTNVTLGYQCEYTATAVGGYQGFGERWRVHVMRPDGTQTTYAASNGSPACRTGVIQVGDRVQVESDVAAVAGAAVRC